MYRKFNSNDAELAFSIINFRNLIHSSDVIDRINDASYKNIQNLFHYYRKECNIDLAKIYYEYDFDTAIELYDLVKKFNGAIE